ncbi:hypothetical protein [Streptomyces cacaoi]|uniref:hypothetical protein n=1 Tax=Streptomyces cacaoi TaxID=1898 RepID=UPI0011F0A9BE|nr:hypothetical protein [Streptomyces cacaoi]
MGRYAKRAKQARRDKRRLKDGLSMGGVPPMFRAEFVRIAAAWDRAVEAGLMADGAETKYHLTPDGGVLSVAEGRSGQVLANGERLTPSVAERLRREMPLLAGMITFYENNQLAGRGLAGAPEDGVMPLAPPCGPAPMPPLDKEALAQAQAATAVLVRQGKVAEPVGAMVIPAPRGGVLFAVGGRDGELYVNGRALTGEWSEELRAKVPELSSDLDRLQAMRAEWLDSPPEDRTLALAGACTDPNCHTPH